MKTTGQYEGIEGVNYTPSKSVVFYEDRAHGAVATVHEIDIVKNRTVLRPGKLVDPAELRASLSDLEGNAPTIFPDERCVGIYKDRMAWWVPAGKRAFFWETGDDAINAFNRVPLVHPALVLVKTGTRELSVFALAANERPNRSTRLFHAPFYNIDSGGSMCTGNIPGATSREAERREFWEEFFFLSAFTHPGSGSPLCRRGKYLDLLGRMSQEAAFPIPSLAPTRLTLEEALQ